MTNIAIPNNATFVSAKTSRDTVNATYADGKVVATDSQLAVDGSFDVTVTLKANNVTQYESNKIQIKSATSAKDLAKELTAKSDEITIKRSELALEQFMDYEFSDEIFKKDKELNFILYAENMTESEKNNVIVETQLPKELTFIEGYMVEGSSEEGIKKIENASYDQTTNKVTWKIDSLKARDAKTLKLNVKVGDLNAGITEDQIKITSNIRADGTEKYKAEDLEVNLGKSSVAVTLNSPTPTYVKEGEIINYTFSIKNEGASPANDIVLTSMVPDGIVVREIAYAMEGQKIVNTMSETENAELELTVPAKSQIDVEVEALASNLGGVKEKTVTSEGTISGENMDSVKSNSVTHIIQADDTNKTEEKSENNGVNGVSGDITKSYKITGTAWLDTNKNGMRDNDEKRMQNVTAMLVDSGSGVIKATVTTNNNGEYAFTGLQNGTYLVLFKYDTTMYTVATYRKEGIESNINSDVVTTKIEQNGQKENGAVTDRIEINGANVTDIDIGLMETDKFSLELEKSISKVTVQNTQGTKTEEFNKAKLAKYDIAAKHLSGTTVYVEYIMTVTNNGDLSGFASEIVDYVPDGMTFNSKLNPEWYTGTDGSLYTKALANTELAKGESKEIKLVLTKQMTTENTGLVSNTAEIADDFNIYGVSDFNSKPKNKAQGEDDMSTADTILTVKTGESLIYLSAIIVSILIGGACAFVVYEKVLKNKRKGGV